MEAHLRQQLSAMMDGELASDEARFLFRRLQHDRELAGCWERWQVCSVVLRGQGTALLPADFSQRVARTVALDSRHSTLAGEQAVAATGTHPRRWAWWGGGALAASLALLVVVPRTASDPGPASAGSDARVASVATIPHATPAPPPSAADASHSPATPPAAAQLTTALAIAEAPRRIAAARRNRAAMPGPDRASTQVSRGIEAADAGQRVAAVEPLELPKRDNPFAAQQQEALPSHPWPRAVLPGTNTGAFTASYSTGSTGAFYPFEPRNLPMPETQQVQAGDGLR
ncbi:MAG: sigma-E factor negative regulatory protein [Thermomonas sp.]